MKNSICSEQKEIRFSQSNTKRIAQNTLFLYFRQLLIMLVSLYTVRVVLDVLGAKDYGIYNVVAGIVTMFSFLSSAMATASQRFFSFELGKGDKERLKKIFSVTLCIYLILILIIVFLAETVGLWFVCNKLAMPAERLNAAKWIYQFSILNFIVTLITTPYMADIIAHENMSVYAYVSIVEAALKLAIVFLLVVLPFDKLIVYGILLFAVGFINTAFYRFYCKRHYEECVFHPVWDSAMFKEITGFTGWTLFGSLSGIARNQAVTILVNQFFNPVVVAARAIAMQVTNALSLFSSNFNTGLYAPIIKEYAAGNKEEMFRLVFNGCKITFFLMWIFALPLYLRMDYVLTLWLKDLPEYVVLFTRLSIIEVLMVAICYPLATAARAPGKMKTYELSLGTLQVSIFFISYGWVKFFHGEAQTVYYTTIIIAAIMFVVRVIVLRGLIELSTISFLRMVCLPILIVSIISLIPSYLINSRLSNTFWSLCIVVIVSFALSTLAMFYIGLNKTARIRILEKIRTKIARN